MRIFVIPSIFPYELNKTAGIFTYEQSKILANDGHEIIVLSSIPISYKHWTKKYLFNYNCIKYDNMTVLEHHHKGFMSSKFPRIAVYSAKKKVFELYKKAVSEFGKPDIICAHFSFTSGYIASLINKEYKIPYIVIEHHSLYFGKYNKKIKNILLSTVKNSYNFFCVSQKLTEKIKSITKLNKLTTLFNPINHEYYFKNINSNNKFVFFSAGNLINTKGFNYLIEAFKQEFANEPNIELRIAGDGVEKNNIIKLINDTKNIKYVGKLDRKQMINEYINCNVFALASSIETFGIVYREAMAIGRPIISFKNDGIIYKWKDEYGYLCDPNINDLAKSMKKIYNNYEKFDLQGISKSVLNDFGFEKYCEYFRKMENEICLNK